MSLEDLFSPERLLDYPRTVRGDLPYWVGALSPREVWGHGHASTYLEVGQTWNDSARFLRYMLGEWVVRVGDGSTASTGPPIFVRRIPEKLRYNDDGTNSDTRVQWCTGLSQTDQGGNPIDNAIQDDYDPSDSTEPFSDGIANWPAAAWVKYQAVFETTPYVIRTDAEISDTLREWGGNAEDGEFLRYVVRSKRTYSKEQPIPAASTAGGFKVISDPEEFIINAQGQRVSKRQSIGQVGFRVVSMADVQYKWFHVPLGWPPPPGWTPPDPKKPWPAPNSETNPRLRDAYIGKINSASFDYCDPEGYCFAAGELLYTGWSEEVFYNASGQRTANVTYSFKFKEGGWNKFLSALGEWKEVSLDGSNAGRRPYESADMRNLFRYVA